MPWAAIFPQSSPSSRCKLWAATYNKKSLSVDRFFVATSSPVELIVSQNGNGLEATTSSAELEVDDNRNILGTVYLVQYNLPVGEDHQTPGPQLL